MKVFRVATCLAASIAAIPAAMHAQAAIPLRNGQQVTLHGVLELRPAGRLQYVTVQTDNTYVPVFAAGGSTPARNGEPVHEIALSHYDYATLYAHRNQQVTVTGKVSTDDASPYYRDGMRLEVTSIYAANGADLTWRESALPPVAADVGLYQVTVVLPADTAAPWRYMVNGTPDSRHMISCSSNGGGDVVNCFCANGFRAANPAATIGGKTAPGQVFEDMKMAQFDVGDEERPKAVTLNLTCSR